MYVCVCVNNTAKGTKQDYRTIKHMTRFHLSSVGFAKVWKNKMRLIKCPSIESKKKIRDLFFKKKCFENEILSNPLNQALMQSALIRLTPDSWHKNEHSNQGVKEPPSWGLCVATASPQNRKSKHQMMSNGQIWWLTCSHTFLAYHKPQFSIFARLALRCFHGSLSTSGPSKSRTTSPTSSFLRTYIALRVSSVVY